MHNKARNKIKRMIWQAKQGFEREIFFQKSRDTPKRFGIIEEGSLNPIQKNNDNCPLHFEVKDKADILHQ